MEKNMTCMSMDKSCPSSFWTLENYFVQKQIYKLVIAKRMKRTKWNQ